LQPFKKRKPTKPQPFSFDNNSSKKSKLIQEKSKQICPKRPNLSTRERKRALPDDCLDRQQEEKEQLEEMKR